MQSSILVINYHSSLNIYMYTHQILRPFFNTIENQYFFLGTACTFTKFDTCNKWEMNCLTKILHLNFSYEQQQRRLDLITITHPDNLDPEENNRIVFITARVHPGETPASYCCQGTRIGQLFLLNLWRKIFFFIWFTPKLIVQGLASSLILKLFIIKDQQISNFSCFLKYIFWYQDEIFQSFKKEMSPLLKLTEF